MAKYTVSDILRSYVSGRPLTEEEQRDMLVSLDEFDAAVVESDTDDSTDGKE